MAELIVVGFEKIDTADQVLQKLRSLKQEYLIDLEDAVVVTRNQEGKVDLKQSINLASLGCFLWIGFWWPVRRLYRLAVL